MTDAVIGILLGMGAVICVLIFGYRCYVTGYRKGRVDAMGTTNSDFKEQG